MRNLPYSLISDLEKVSSKTNPPVHLWHPDTEKPIDLVIKENGVWEYEGSPINRPRLVRLFSSVLRREGDSYYLVTPVEKCLISVEDVPFEIVLMQSEGEGINREIAMTTSTGYKFPLDKTHPLTLRRFGSGVFPYVFVRDNMEGRLNRNVYYQLAEFFEDQKNINDENPLIQFWSCETLFSLKQPDATG